MSMYSDEVEKLSEKKNLELEFVEDPGGAASVEIYCTHLPQQEFNRRAKGTTLVATNGEDESYLDLPEGTTAILDLEWLEGIGGNVSDWCMDNDIDYDSMPFTKICDIIRNKMIRKNIEDVEEILG